jgi:predicted nucleic acid-binding protein
LILVDTNVWSELLKPQRNERVLQWLSNHASELLLSAIVLAELRFYVAKQTDGRRKRWAHDVVTAIDAGVGERFAEFGSGDALCYGELMARLRAEGTPIPLPDGWIAAQALARRIPVATRNLRDFARTGVVLIDPWNA